MPSKPHDPSYRDGSKDVPLLNVKPLRDNRSGTERRRATPVAAHAHCPLHATGAIDPNEARRTGLMWVGEHLVWHVHYYKVGRNQIPCRASGIAICNPDAQPTDGMMRMVQTQRAIKAGIDPMRKAQCEHETDYDKSLRSAPEANRARDGEA